MMTNLLKAKRIVFPDGTVKYILSGRTKPDTFKSLVKAGLVETKRLPNGEQEDTFLQPEHPRVICWIKGLKESAAKFGWPDLYPNYPVNLTFYDINKTQGSA
jgi:hypothetical protein